MTNATIHGSSHQAALVQAIAREELGTRLLAAGGTVEAAEEKGLGLVAALGVAGFVLSVPGAVLATLKLAERPEFRSAVERFLVRLDELGVQVSLPGHAPVQAGEVEPTALLSTVTNSATAVAWDVFIAHGSRDATLAKTIATDLRSRDLHVYRLQASARLGLHRPYADLGALRAAHVAVVLLSPGWPDDPVLRDLLPRMVQRHELESLSLVPAWVDGVPTDEAAVPLGLMGMTSVDLSVSTADSLAAALESHLSAKR